MDDRPETAAGISSPSTALLDALRDWRWAEVNHAAIVLGMRVGDEQDARRASELALNSLRIAADKALSSNNVLTVSGGPGETSCQSK
jgi:hypothetical protein